MKKILKILLCFALYLAHFSTPKIIVHATQQYARIENSTYLYKTSNDSVNLDNIYCIAEKSYFVEIIGDYGNFFRVNYNGQTGFIKRNDVKEITNQPNTPYPSNIKILVGNSCNLRKTPTTQVSVSNVIDTIHSNETNITFIGRTIGEESFDFGGTTWYYVKYNGNYGYIYSNYLKSITPIYENQETVIYKDNFTPERTINPITHTPSIILIIILFIPFIVILVILYYNPKSKRSSSKPKSKNILDKY